MASPWASYTSSPLEDANAPSSRTSHSIPVIPHVHPPRTTPTGIHQGSRRLPRPSRRPTTETPQSAWDQWQNTPAHSQRPGPSLYVSRRAPSPEAQSHDHPRSQNPQLSSQGKPGSNSLHIHLSWPTHVDLPIGTPEVRLLNPRAFDTDVPSSYLSRSVSSGSSVGTYREHPQQWRRDFEFKSGFASIFRNRSNPARASYGVADSSKLDLHPLLRYSKLHQTMKYDLRRKPETLEVREFGRSLLADNTDYSVTRPPTRSMRIYHPRLPWYIDITAAANTPCIFLEDFFLQLFAALDTPISKSDFYNDKLDEEDRRVLNYTFRGRYRSEREKMEGVKRVDFLRGKFEWLGLKSGKDGMWRLKTG